MSSSVAAPTHPSTWSAVRAPTIAPVTPGQARVQAIATSATEAPWRQGDFFDSAVGGHGNILRFFNLAFTEAYAPDARLNLELVEFQNRKKPLLEREITDIGVAYFGFEVRNLEAFIERAVAAGATPVAETGIVTMQSGTREVMLRDPDTRAFVLFYEQPR